MQDGPPPPPRTASRRASTGAVSSAAAALGDPFPDGYGTDDDDDANTDSTGCNNDSHNMFAAVNRRASFSGPIARRRGSSQGFSGSSNRTLDLPPTVALARTSSSVSRTQHQRRRTSNSSGADSKERASRLTRSSRRLAPPRTLSSSSAHSRGFANGPQQDVHQYDEEDKPKLAKPELRRYSTADSIAGVKQPELIRYESTDSVNQPNPPEPRRGRRRASQNGNGSSSGDGASVTAFEGRSLLGQSRGINPDVVARMSRRGSAGFGATGDDDSDDEDGPIGAPTGNANDIYGYASQKMVRRLSSASKQSRRNSSSSSSVHSRSSRSSRRRSTSFRDKDPLAAAGLYPPRASSALSVDTSSDMEGDSSASESDGPLAAVDKFGYESDQVSESDRSHTSLSSSKRSRRRNSCIIRPDALGPVDMSEEEDNDPDSLLNRAKGKVPNNVKAKKAASTLRQVDSQEATDVEDNELLFENLDRPAWWNQRTIGADAAPVNTPTVGVKSTVEAWRKSPLTISYAAPTAENLKDSVMMSPTTLGAKLFGREPNANRDGWGELDLRHPDDSLTPASSDVDSQQSYGASMYTVNQVYQEIDMYQQKARRRASLENTCVDIDNYMDVATKVKGVKVPNFRPAEGCRNASDFVVRCFSARLRISGFTILKHNRSRWSKGKNRVIYLLPDGKTLTWRSSDDDIAGNGGGSEKAHHSKRPKIDLSTCLEIRHAWSADPAAKNKRGTPVLRSRCKEGLAGKSFALIFKQRSLDFTAFSNDQCKVMMEGFSALCFRLQLQRLEDSEEHSVRVPISECDWASTIYGGSTNTSSSLPVSLPIASTPWGC